MPSPVFRSGFQHDSTCATCTYWISIPPAFRILYPFWLVTCAPSAFNPPRALSSLRRDPRANRLVERTSRTSWAKKTRHAWDRTEALLLLSRGSISAELQFPQGCCVSPEHPWVFMDFWCRFSSVRHKFSRDRTSEATE